MSLIKIFELVYISEIEFGLAWYVLLYETVCGITVVKMLGKRGGLL